MDAAGLRALVSGPGADTRGWLYHGVVDASTSAARSVLFNDEDGNPLPYPMVLVTLQPSGAQVACRVGSSCAGNGEGEWHPFADGDEVLVGVTEGDERAGCHIIHRLNQARDVFPTKVSGNDTTQNSVAFKRLIPPYVLESATSLLLHVGSTNSYLSLDQTGNVTLGNGDSHYLALHSDVVTLSLGDSSCFLQMNPTLQQVYLQAGGTSLLLDAGQAPGVISQFMSAGPLAVVTGNGGPYALGHAITLEQVTVLLWALVTGLGPLFTVPLNPAAVLALINALIPVAAVGTVAPFELALTTALQVPPDPTGLLPGVGRPGFTY